MRNVKKIIATVLSVVMILSMIMITPAMATDNVTGMILYVSPIGNDSADGSEKAPLKTLQGARNKIRSIKSSAGLPNGGITVVFREGIYNWTDTVEFEMQDSGTAESKIVYRSYPGEKVYFEGGVKIPGSQFTPVTDEEMLMKWSNNKVKQNIRQLDIKSVMTKAGYSDISAYYPFTKSRYGFGNTYGTFVEGEKEAEEDQSNVIRRPIFSFEGMQAMWPARYPNKSGGLYADVNPLTQTLKIGEVVKNGGTKEISIFKYTDRRISKYAGRDDVFLGGNTNQAYYHTEQEITIDAQSTTITSKTPMDSGVRGGMSYYIFNVLEELDAPGEYFIDKNTGIMYTYPLNDISNSHLNVSVFDKKFMITTKNASHITFSGIILENTKGSGAFIDGGDSIRFEYCEFVNMGAQAIKVGRNEGVYTQYGFGPRQWTDTATLYKPFTAETTGSNNWANWQTLYWQQDKFSTAEHGKNHSFYGNHFMNIGDSGVEVVAGNMYRDEDANIVFENNLFEFMGQYKRTYSPAIKFTKTHGLIIRNNTIRHCPSSAINGNSTLTIIEGNHVYDVLMESYDMTALYFNYTMPSLKFVIEGNYIHDIPNEMEEVTTTSTLSQRAAIGFDSNHGGGRFINNNQIVNVPIGMFAIQNNQYNNNVWVDVHKPFHVTTQNLYYPMKAEKFADNLNEDVFSPKQYFATIPGLPIYADGEIGEQARKVWTEKYPSVMNWHEIMQSQKHEGKNFFESIDTLVVNKNTVLSNSNVNYSDAPMYKGEEVMYKDIKNYTQTSDTSIFEDYENRNYQITPEGAAKYGIKPLDLSKTGTQSPIVGAFQYADAKVALPKAENTGSASPSISVPSQIQNAVVLKIGASDALVNGKVVKVDVNNESVMPNIINSRTLVPARFITESFGGEVGWDDATRTVTLKMNGKTINMVLDKAELMIDGTVATVMDVPAQSIEGRTMVPLRALCETALSKKVFWDPKGLIVISDIDNILDSAKDASVIDSILGMLK